jgi:hypothetical protein
MDAENLRAIQNSIQVLGYPIAVSVALFLSTWLLGKAAIYALKTLFTRYANAADRLVDATDTHAKTIATLSQASNAALHANSITNKILTDAVTALSAKIGSDPSGVCRMTSKEDLAAELLKGGIQCKAAELEILFQQFTRRQEAAQKIAAQTVLDTAKDAAANLKTSLEGA